MTAEAKVKIKADPTQLPTGLRRALKMIQGFVHQTTGLMNPKKSKDPDRGSIAMGSMVGNVASQLAMRGIDLLVDQTKQVFDFNKELIRFGIDIRKLPKDMEPIGRQIRDISNQTGLGAIEVLKAGRAYVDLAGASAFTAEKMSLIARSAQASGASVKDMASLMFTLTENMKVPESELEDTMGGLINQAKDGSIHFRELATELVALGPVYAQYGIKGREGANQLGALMQIARRGFGSASEAGTGVLRILRSIPQHASKFRAAGIQVFHDKSKSNLENFLTIIERIKKSKLELDREKLMKAFGRTEGERFYQLLKDSNDQFQLLIGAARENGTVAKDLGTFTESSAGRIDIAMQKVKNAFADALTPERINQIVGGIELMVKAMGPLMTIVGKVADKLFWIANKLNRLDQISEGDSKYEFTEAEQSLLIREEQANKHVPAHQLNATGRDLKQRADALRARAAAYNTAIRSIMGEEMLGSPTEESVRRAMRASYASSEMERHAGRSYLTARDKEIPESMYKRMKAEVVSEIQAERAKLMGGFDFMDKSRQEQGEKFIRKLADAIATVVNNKPTGVFIDGNPVATAGDNASKRRRK